MPAAKSFRHDYTSADLIETPSGSYILIEHGLDRSYPLIALYSLDGNGNMHLESFNIYQVSDNAVKCYPGSEGPWHVRVIA